MIQKYDKGQFYICPMHPSVREPKAAKCPQCDMALLPEGTQFAMLRHMVQHPLILIVMVAFMMAAMLAVMPAVRE